MKRGFLNSKKAKNIVLYPEPSKNATGVSTTTTPAEKHPEMRLSYGKVANNDIPEDYKPLQREVKEVPNDFKHQSPNEIVMTTMPPTQNPADPHNRTEWVTRYATKLKVLNISGFPRPVPKPAKRNYIVKDTEKMGKGVFATRDINIGELIFSERPLIVVPGNCNILGVDPPAHYTVEQQKRIIIMEWEKKLEVVVEERMEEKDRIAFKELQNSHTEDGSGPILGVIRTNGFGILRNFDKDDFAMTGSYSAVGKIASRVNHSCMPNVRCTFSTPSFSLQFTAVKDIKAGEQLFYSYVSPTASAQDRQANLAPYGVICECYACANATPDSDRLHEEFSQRIQHFNKLSDEWIKRPGNWLSEKVLDPVFELREAIEKEGLDTELNFSLLLVVFHKVYTKLGLTAKAQRYQAELARAIFLPRPD